LHEQAKAEKARAEAPAAAKAETEEERLDKLEELRAAKKKEEQVRMDMHAWVNVVSLGCHWRGLGCPMM
jgi:hypothetical protein